MKYTILLISLLINISTSYAQHYITGQVIDHDMEPLIGATVVLIDQDSTMISFGLTNNDGKFQLEDIKKGLYILQVTYVGHANYSRSIDPSWSEKNIKLDPIILAVSSEMLQVVTIKAEHIPMGIHGDTISYNAAAFKTKANATVEDLLKQLPGIDVKRDGSIVAQGKEVDKVMVDGKEFFGSNTKMATQNIEAKAVDKVEVFDKKSEEAEFTGVDDGNDKKTINLKLKEDFKTGGFGNAFVSGSPDKHYKTKLNYFRFSPALQASVIFTSNNVNEETFGWSERVDFLGGFANAMNSSLMSNFGGKQDESGLTKALTTGVNFNYELNPKLKFTSFYFYDQTNKDLQKKIRKEIFSSDFSFINLDTLSSITNDQAQKAHIKIVSNINKKTKITLKSTFNWDTGDNNRNLNSENIKNSTDNSHSTSILSRNDGRNKISSSLLLNRKMEKKGRSVSGNFHYNNTTTYFNYLVDNLGDILGNTYMLNQHQVTDNRNTELKGGIKYTEPLKNKYFLSIDYNTNLLNEKPISNYYDIIDNKDVLNAQLSNIYEKDILKHSAGISIKKTNKKITASIGLTAQIINLKGIISNPATTIDNTYKHLKPRINITYKPQKGKNIRAGLYSYVQTPTLNQLHQTINNRNPNIIYNGNPKLKPSQNYRARISYSIWDQFSFTSLWSNIYLNYTRDRIVNKVSIDDNLIQTRTPINSDKYIELGSRINFSRPIKPLYIKYNINVRYQFSNYNSYINNLNSSIVEHNKSIKLKLENRNKEKISIATGAKYSHNTRKYEISEDYNQKYDNINYFVDIEAYLPKGWTAATSYTYYDYRNSTFRDNPSYNLWMISVSKLFLNDKLELRFDANDLLNQNIGYNRTSDINSYEESYFNYLGRYFMLGINYKLGKKKGK